MGEPGAVVADKTGWCLSLGSARALPGRRGWADLLRVVSRSGIWDTARWGREMLACVAFAACFVGDGSGVYVYVVVFVVSTTVLVVVYS